jgi:hypothetical protein
LGPQMVRGEEGGGAMSVRGEGSEGPQRADMVLGVLWVGEEERGT